MDDQGGDGPELGGGVGVDVDSAFVAGVSEEVGQKLGVLLYLEVLLGLLPGFELGRR